MKWYTYFVTAPKAPLKRSNAGVWGPVARGRGFSGLVYRYLENDKAFEPTWVPEHLRQDLGPGGFLALLPAEDNERGEDWYAWFVQNFSWSDFYALENQGRKFMKSLAEAFKNLGYDYLFIDARTGLTDVANITLLHMPDQVVLITNLSRQSVDGIHWQLQNIQGCNDQISDSTPFDSRRTGAETRKIEILLVGSPLVRGEWESRQKRLNELAKQFGRPLDVQVDHLPFLSLDESNQILAQHFKEDIGSGHHIHADHLLTGALEPYARLAEAIIHRNPDDPEIFLATGRSLMQVGLWRPALAHFGEVLNRLKTRIKALDSSSGQISQQLAPTLRAAYAEKLRAQHEGLNPENDRNMLLEMQGLFAKDINGDTSGGIRLEFARLWLGMAFPFLLLNRNLEVVAVTNYARSMLEPLESTKNVETIDLLVLVQYQQAEARVVSGQWASAEIVSDEAVNTYRRLRTRPLLLGLSLTQAAVIKIRLCNIKEATRCINEADRIAQMLSSDHLNANLAYANAMVLLEQGDETGAMESLSNAFACFARDNDDVGQVNVIAAAANLDWNRFPRSENEQFYTEGMEEKWARRADEQLRMPATAARLRLAAISRKIAGGDAESLKSLATLFSPRIGAEYVDVTSNSSSTDTLVKAMVSNACRIQLLQQDAALGIMILLDGCRALMCAQPCHSEENSHGTQIIESLKILLAGIDSISDDVSESLIPTLPSRIQIG